jgi:predicted DCC family thiol-disulfide oxidoreductase YuxK
MNTIPTAAAVPESALRRCARAWTRFWFEPVHSHSLCLLRVFFGAVMTLRALRIYGLYRFNHLEPALPRYEYDAAEMYGDFTMPWSLFDWIPSPDIWWYARIDEITFVLLVLFTIGFGTRIVAPLLAAIYAYVFLASQCNYYHHVWCYTLVFSILAFSHCGDRYSVDSLLRGPAAARPLRMILPLRLIQVLMTVLYLFTCINKLNPGYLSGRIIFLFHEAGSIEGVFYQPVLDLIGYRGLGVFTVMMEGFVPLAIWFPRLRLLAIGVGVVLHLSIDMMMSQRTFSYQMMTLYIAFIHPAAGATIVLVDGTCALCRRARRFAGPFDWLRRLTWLDAADPAVASTVPASERAALQRGLGVITPEGRLRFGFAAWQQLLLRSPLTLLPALLLWIPGVRELARWGYRRLAAHRKRGGHVLSPATAIVPADTEAPWHASLAKCRSRRGPAGAATGVVL